MESGGKMLTKQDTHIRWLIRRDLEKVVEIDGVWNREDFIQRLRCRRIIGLVLEYKDEVIGFIVYELQKPYLNILRLAVDQEAQRMGFGTDLINRLKSKLSHERRNRLSIYVEDTNLATQLFLRSNGFLATQIIGDEYLMEFFL